MRGRPVTRAQRRAQAPYRAPDNAHSRVRIAVTGAGLSLMLAMIVPFTLLPHPARGVGLPNVTGPGVTESIATLASSAPAQTQLEQGHANWHSTARTSGRQLSRAEAVALVERRYHARVVRTQLLQDAHGRPVYAFRLLSTGGKVWTVHIDAYSGAELP